MVTMVATVGFSQCVSPNRTTFFQFCPNKSNSCSMDFVITKCNYKRREKQKGRSLEPSQRMHTITWKWKQDQMETQRGPGGIYLVGPVGLDTDRFVWDFLIFITQVLHPRKPSVPGASVGHHMAVLTVASFPCPVGIEDLLSQLLFSCSVVSSSLWPYGLQHARLPCPSLSPGACSNERALMSVLMSIESVMPSYHLILSRSLLLLPSGSPSIRVFSNESALWIMWPKYWSFSFAINPSNKYSGLISFKIDWFDLFAVQGILKSLLQQHSSKALILWHSAFFMVQLLHPYMTTGKTIALTRWTSISMQTEPIASRGEGIHWKGPCVTLHNERCVPHLAACAFPGKTSLLNGIQFIVSRRALLLMPLWLALGLVNIGMWCWSKGTMPSWQMDSCAGMLWNQQVHQVWKRQTRREFQKVRAETEAQETQGYCQGSAKSFEIFWKWNEVDQCPLKGFAKEFGIKEKFHPLLFFSFFSLLVATNAQMEDHILPTTIYDHNRLEQNRERVRGRENPGSN